MTTDKNPIAQADDGSPRDGVLTLDKETIKDLEISDVRAGVFGGSGAICQPTLQRCQTILLSKAANTCFV